MTMNGSQDTSLERMLVSRAAAERQQVPWSAARWTTASADASPARRELADAAVLGQLATRAKDGRLTRAHVAEAAEGPLDLLIASMAWGFGTNGYGPTRTAKMLATSGCAALATDIVDTTRREGAGAGFMSLFKPNRRGRIWGLGVAMGTKVLYFAARGGVRTVGPRPLIYDQFVHAGIGLLPADEQPRLPDGGALPAAGGRVSRVAYETWCGWAHDQATTRGVPVDDIEHALFAAGRAKGAEL